MKRWDCFKDSFWKMYHEQTVEQLIGKRRKKIYGCLSLVGSALLICVLWIKLVYDITLGIKDFYSVSSEIVTAVMVVIGLGTIIVLLIVLCFVVMAVNLSHVSDFLDLMIYFKKVFR